MRVSNSHAIATGDGFSYQRQSVSENDLACCAPDSEHRVCRKRDRLGMVGAIAGPSINALPLSGTGALYRG